MRSHEDDGGGRREAHQRGAKQRARRHIEGCAGLEHADAICFGLPLVRAQRGKIDLVEAELRNRRHPLNRCAVDFVKGGAQHLVTLDDLEPRLFQQIGGHAPFEAPTDRHIVCGIARIQAIQQPESFLRDRARKVRPLERSLGARGFPRAVGGSGAHRAGIRSRIENLVGRLRHGLLYHPTRRLRLNCPSVGNGAPLFSGTASAAPASTTAASARALRCCSNCLAVILMSPRFARAVIWNS